MPITQYAIQDILPVLHQLEHKILKEFLCHIQRPSQPVSMIKTDNEEAEWTS